MAPRRIALASFLLVATSLFAAGEERSAGLSLEFASPAQIGGDTTSDVQAALVFFHNGSAKGSFDVTIDSITNRTFVRTAFDLAAHQVGASPGTELPPRTQGTTAHVEGMVGFEGAEWASILVEARTVSLRTWNGAGELLALPANDRLDSALNAAYRSNSANPGDSTREPAVAFGTATSERFELRAENITRLRWSNLQIECGVAVDCPDRAGGTNRTYSTATGDWMRIRTVSFTELSVSAGHMEIRGQSAGLVGVGAPMTIQGNGSLRLPLSIRAEPCSECFDPAGATIAGEGHFVLSNLMPPPEGRARIDGVLDGDLSTLRIDESVRDPRSLADEWQAVAVGGTVAALGLTLLWRLLVPLFSRIVTREDAVRSPTRTIVLQAVRDHPGQTYRALMKITGKSDGSVRHHLAHLTRHGYVMTRTHQGRVLYFDENGGRDQDWETTAAARDENLRRLLELVTAMPGASQTDLILHSRTAWGDSRKTTQKRLGRLVAAKLVAVRLEGRVKRYSALPLQRDAPTRPNPGFSHT